MGLLKISGIQDDAIPYYEGIMAGQPAALVRSFAGEPVLDDPRVGYVEGGRQLRAFAIGTAGWLRERDAVAENVALTSTPTRTVEEVVLHLLADSGERVELPVAIVSDRNPDRTLKAIRVYHSMWPLTGEHRVRSPLLPADPELRAGAHRTTTNGRWPRATWKASWRPSSPTVTPASRAGGRTSTAAPRRCGNFTLTCSPTGAASRWSIAPSPTTACGAPSSTTVCAGG
jgi:hypothetical protein